MTQDDPALAARSPEADVDPRFPGRWSPRSFRDEPVPDEDLASVFEAARWAPSCYNDQPWLFVYARGEEDRARVAGLLVPGNRKWAERAPVLGVVFTRKRFAHNGKDNASAQFDAGAASLSLALQARERGLYTHFMAGFDRDASYAALGVDAEEYLAMAAFALGHRGDPEQLPEELREREKPSGRKPLAEVAVEGRAGP